MRISTLLARNLAWYWRTNLAVLAGVATAAGVLGGALLVGDSVRASLRDLIVGRLGNADSVVSRSNGFFREELAAAFGPACPLISIGGVIAHRDVQVYGVDDRFWKFQGVTGDRQTVLTAALARALGVQPGGTVLLRVEKPSAIPLESLHGRKDDVGKTIRLTVGGIAPREFSLRPQQGDVLAVFVPLARLQRDLNQPGRVNTILVAKGAGAPERVLKERFTLDDLGIKLRALEKQHALALETDSAYIGDELAVTAEATARSLKLGTLHVLTYLANAIRANGREIPYSVVTAVDTDPPIAEPDGIELNQWAARELAAKPGDKVQLEYYVWRSDGQLHTQSAEFRLSHVVALEGFAADRDFTPDYPGITTSNSLHDWDPPFPIDLKRVRPIDEEYWKQYRTTPKAFLPLARGQQLWGTRFGKLTSIRILPPSDAFAGALRNALDPARMGLTVFPVKAQGLASAQGATDFGEYFAYFSIFLIVSTLMLTGLFFKLGVEQRTREIGTLRALGFSMAKIRVVFLLEGALVAVAGAVVGLAGALAYGALIMYGLRTWWVDAVGTKLLALHPSAASLAAGAIAGIVAGLGAIAWTLRSLQPVTPRGLLAGEQKTASGRRPLYIGAISVAGGLALLAAALAGQLDQAAGFFGAGTLLLIGAVAFELTWLRSPGATQVHSRIGLGLRSATYRPGRSILCIALIAAAVFLIVALDAFRRDAAPPGEFALVGESAIPLIHDPNSAAGRDALNLPPLAGVRFVSFRMRSGDDASCLNLYQPRNPRIMAPPASFLHGAPWNLLDASPPDGAIPAIADANSMTYALHLKVGEEFTLDGVRYRMAGALEDSLFQSELLISERNFLRLFPDVEGWRFFLIKGSPQVARTLESALSDYGFHVETAQARMARFHQVENTYLSTFRSLGALGLVLGTVGLAAILLRNVLERRRELALLRAVGYRPAHLAVMVLAENVLLLLLGLVTGTVCALLAIVPTVSQRGGHLPALSIGLLLAAVLLTGIAASLCATAAALRSPVLEALKSE